MKEEGGLQPEELAIVFPNLHEILDMHQKLKDGFIGLKKNDGYVIKAVGPVLREMVSRRGHFCVTVNEVRQNRVRECCDSDSNIHYYFVKVPV